MAVTRAEVARLAGVSPAVVSYVLRPGLRPVSRETREKVLAAVEELGYRPNAIAQALRAGPTQTLGLLVPDHVNPFFSQLTRAVENAAFGRGYVLLSGSTADDQDRETRYIRAFVDRKVDALLLIAAQSHPELDAAVDAGIPTVVLDRVPDGVRVSTVRSDGLNGSRIGVEHLISLGHRRVGIVAGPRSLDVADDRVIGWRMALSEAGLPSGDDLIQHAPFSAAGGYRAASDLLADPEVTALFVSSDVQATGALSACRRLGRSVPADVSLVSFDGTELAPHTNPPLTVIQQPIEAIARGAVDRLMSQMKNPSTEPVHEVLDVALVVQESTAAPRGVSSI
ncbi:LacI family DNA-binding transcriptional regulator [Streptomyces sp. PT12]|uniref:LacI family DNA-binding transcriptional regulator n=1 Tax=Streptomyces sp. PT12 TaxID=1510197 RepID=UPI0015EF82D9|nr:LacI family DNA-binding transcriptional regulator [Streptomyces sp. PT12]